MLILLNKLVTVLLAEDDVTVAQMLHLWAHSYLLIGVRAEIQCNMDEVTFAT